MRYYQQGDVLIKVAKEIPEGSERINSLVLAEGEATGHAHRIPETYRSNVEMYEKNGALFLRVLETVPLTHEEHGVINLPKNDYVIERVREYDHFSEEAREVRD